MPKVPPKATPKKKIFDDTSKLDGYDNLNAKDKKIVEDEMKALSKGNSDFAKDIMDKESDMRSSLTKQTLTEIDALKTDEDKVALYLTLLGTPPADQKATATEYKNFCVARDA